MQSAFGVDHGEISKVGVRFRKPMRGMPGSGRRPTRAQRRTQGTPGSKSGPQAVANAARKVTEANISLKGIGEGASKGVQGVGGFFERRPGLTGTALVGGGGALGYQSLKDKKKAR